MRLGVRVQILVSLAALLAIAFVPLYFAVAGLTEASLYAARREAARELGRAIASHVLSESKLRATASVDSLLDAQLSDGGVVAIGLYDREGRLATSGGDASQLPRAIDPQIEIGEPIGPKGGWFVVVPGQREDGSVGVVLALDPGTVPESPLTGLVGLYTGVIALTLLVFAYFAMTRLIVRPIEQLSTGARRVAAGARTIAFQTPSAREYADLSESLRTMLQELVKNEQALMGKIAELEATTTELRHAQAKGLESERLASVGRLSAGLAHEIGNPIAAIMGFQELLLTGDLPPDEARDFLGRMKRETERVHRVLRDLLDFARAGKRVPTGKLDEGDALTDVKACVESVVSLLGPQQNLAHLELKVSVEPHLPEVRIREEALRQVLLNLTLNAVDAATTAISIEVRRTEDAVLIVVADDGEGVPMSMKGRLFEPFVTSKEPGKGTGLGLAVCRGLVESAGGAINLAAHPEWRGAAFEVRLPFSVPREGALSPSSF